MPRFNYVARGKDAVLRGSIHYNYSEVDDYLRKEVLLSCAELSQKFSLPWDPFNVNLVIVRAQNEPKPE